MKVKEITSLRDLDGNGVGVTLATWEDSEDESEGVIFVGHDSARFNPRDEHSLGQLRELIAALQELERDGVRG